MVEISSLYDLDIYTITGHYVGQVADIVLNIRLGTVSKLQVKALEPEKKQVGFRDIMRRSFSLPEENQNVRTYKSELLTIDFDKVQAIGDILLINPRDIKSVPQFPPQETVIPNTAAAQQNEIYPEPENRE